MSRYATFIFKFLSFCRRLFPRCFFAFHVIRRARTRPSVFECATEWVCMENICIYNARYQNKIAGRQSNRGTGMYR